LPIQGETGVWPVSDAMLEAARSACDDAGALLIFDEIQTGMGRTGTLWAFQQTAVRPDVFTVAKSLASGLPVGAVVAGEAAAGVLEVGDHGTTFGGGPLVCAAALATLDVIDDERMLGRVRELGTRLFAGLDDLRRLGRLADVRGRGLLAAADLPPDRAGEAPAIVREALGSRLVLNATGPDTLRFLPPFTIDEADVDRVIERCAAQGVNPGYALRADYPEYADGLLVAITERRTRAEIDRFVEVLGAAVAAERDAVGVGT
jgi:acetylornithine/succinyldiaminopimelate/putrescine aminotransferase